MHKQSWVAMDTAPVLCDEGSPAGDVSAQELPGHLGAMGLSQAWCLPAAPACHS